MDVISIKVNFVIVPIDGYTGETPAGTVFAVTSDGKRALKKDGCLVFYGLSDGKYEITAGGGNYISQTLELETSERCQTVEVTLMPSRSYKFNSACSKLFGRFDGADGKAEVIFPLENTEARLMGEYKKGERKISAFLSEMLLRTNAKLAIDGAGYGIKQLSAVEFELSRPLESDAGINSVLGVMYDVTPNRCGEYFLAVRGSYKTAVAVYKGVSRTVELKQSENEYNFFKER